MVQLLRSIALGIAVCVACVAATTWACSHASVETLYNRSGDLHWLMTTVGVALAAVVVAAVVAGVCSVALLELAGGAVAGGELANGLMFRLYDGVPDFVHAGGWVYSLGDLAVLAGIGLFALGLARAVAKAVA